eukprot:492265_1
MTLLRQEERGNIFVTRLGENEVFLHSLVACVNNAKGEVRCAATSSSLVVKLGAAPVAALLVPLDAVAGAKADPVGNRLVLLELLTVLLLDGERLETSHVSFVAIKYRNCN